MKKIQITLLILCFATGLQAQIIARPSGRVTYKPMTNENIVTSFLSDREKLQLLQTSPAKPAGISNVTSLGAKSTIGICTSDNPGMTSFGQNVGEVNKHYMSIQQNGWLCLEIKGVEKGYYAFEINLIKDLGVKEFYVAPAPQGWALATDMMKINSNNKKLVFMRELQGETVNYIFIYAANMQVESAFLFSNAQVSKINL